MKLTILQLLNAGIVLQQLAPQKLPGLATLHIRRMAAKLGPDLQAAAAARNALLVPDNSDEIQPGVRRIKPECTGAFLAAPLFAEVIEIDVAPLHPADIAEAMVSKDELDLLGPLFVDDGK